MREPAAWQAEVAAALRAEDGAAAPAGLDAEDRARFRVYRNNVAVGLTGALAAAYPVTRRLVGEAFFTATAKAFVAAHPPRSRSLALYGAAFPSFLAAFPPARGVAYLGDVARLERAVLEALHAADAAPLAPDVLAGLGERAAAAGFTPHPAARLVASPHPIGSLWEGHRGGEGPVRVEARPEAVLVTRPGERVLVHTLSPAAGRFVASLLDGATAATAAEAAFAVDPDFDPLTGWRPLLAGGALVAVNLGDPQ
ncbi:MAG: DUF2063 domain-containing protein [Alphaproteobacteria bacterium]|nr:DUF2063 domain-containing protein [Alphaproteobacteria bacterium]